MKLFNRDVRVIAKKTVHEVLDDNVLGYGAEVAYNFFFGLFPLLLFAAPLLSLVGDRRELLSDILTRAAPSLPPAAFALLVEVLQDVVYTDSAPGLMSIGALLALWAGAGMFSSLMSALNAAYDVTETRPWWRQKLTAIACAIASVILLMSATTILVAGEQIVELIVRLLLLGPIGEIVWTISQYALAFALVTGFVWMLYFVLPNARLSAKATLPGAIFATIGWALFTYLFRLYVTNFASYNKTYGTIGAVIVLLTWMYWTSVMILIGGELNSELHAGTGVTAGPVTNPSPGGRIPTREGLPNPSSHSS
jgi:membrane protein